MQHPKRVWSRDELLDQIWGVDYIGDKKLLMFIFVGYVKKLKSILLVQQKYSLYAVSAADFVNNFLY